MEIELPIQSAISPDVPGRSGPDALTKAATALNSPREGGCPVIPSNLPFRSVKSILPGPQRLYFRSPASQSSQTKPGRDNATGSGLACVSN